MLKFEQREPRQDLFHVDLPKEAKPSDPRLRGRLWLDETTGQLWREHHEIIFRSAYAPEPLVLIRTEYDFGPGSFGLWLPQRVVLSHFKLLKISAGKKAVEMYRSARARSEYNSFRRFEVEVREGNITP